MKIIIADDHPIFREGLIKIISGEPELEIVAHTGDGSEALKLIRAERPNLAILDVSMPNQSGLDVVKTLKSEGIDTEFIILTMYKEEAYFNEALDLGVKGYVLKENATSDLIACIQTVADGRYYVSPIISDYLVNRGLRQTKLHEEMPTLEKLTTTERRILKLIAENKTSKQIADELFVSHRTVQNHRTNICEKLNLRGHNKLLQFALENKGEL